MNSAKIDILTFGFSERFFGSFLEFPNRLFWLLALVLPVLIHLWNRRRKQELPWAAMDFLNEAIREDLKRIRFETMLLLAIRCLLIGCFVIAISQPKIKSTSSLVSRRSHLVFVVDTSFSMGRRKKATSFFEESKLLIQRFVEQQLDNQVYSLVQLDSEGRQVVAFPFPDGREFSKSIARLTIEPRTANLERTLESVEALLDNAKRVDPEIEFQHVIFFSDLQRSTWTEAAVESLVRFQAEASADKVSIVQLTGPPMSNLAIQDMRVMNEPLILGEEVEVQASVRNTGSLPVSGEITLLENDQVIDSKRIDLPAGQSLSALFSFDVRKPGDHLFQVNLSKDDLALDNTRFHVARAYSTIAALCVEGRYRSSRYVAAALKAFGNGKCVTCDTVSETELASMNLSSFELICLCNVGRLAEWERERLTDFVRSGGLLIVFAGGQTDVESLNLLLKNLNSVEMTEVLRFNDAVDYSLERSEHSLSKTFTGLDGFGAAATWKYFLVEPKSSLDPEATEIAVWFATGDPGIIHSRFHAGSLFLVTTNSSDELSRDDSLWTAWPLLPGFAPMIHEMVRHPFVDRSMARNGQVGDDFKLPVPRSISPMSLVADHEDEKLQMKVKDAQYALSPSRVGFYDVRSNSDSVFDRIAVNCEAKESNLTTWPMGTSGDIGHSTPDRFDRLMDTKKQNTNTAFYGFLLVTLLLLMFDSAVAWHYGRK